MEPHESILHWHFTFDNPNFLGWTVVAVYISSAACCVMAALKDRENMPTFFPLVWWVLAIGLTFLGINKQLNLQTLMIVIGRNASAVGHWYGARRKVQLIFSIVFAVLCLGALVCFWKRYLMFFKENQLVLAGAIVLALFVTLRSATINHMDDFLHIKLKDKDWAWALEIIGSGLIGFGAVQRLANVSQK